VSLTEPLINCTTNLILISLPLAINAKATMLNRHLLPRRRGCTRREIGIEIDDGQGAAGAVSDLQRVHFDRLACGFLLNKLRSPRKGASLLASSP